MDLILQKRRNKALSKNVKLVLFIFLFTTFSGAVRKWGTSSSAISNIILFIQLLIPFLFFYFNSKLQRNKKLFPVLIFYAIYLVITAFNVKNLTYFHGILGLILHLGFWLALFVYISERHLFPLERIIPYVIIVLIFEGFLGFIQYTLPFDHFLNRYATDNADINIARIYKAVRITGTFSFISGFGALLVFFGFFVWSSFILKYSNLFRFLLVGIGLLLSFMNGSRAISFIFILLVIFGVLSSGSITAKLRILFSSIILVIITLAVNLVYPIGIIENSIGNFTSRVKENQEQGEQARRIINPVEEIINFKGNYPIMGVGLGATYQGANAIWGESPFVLEYGGYEEEAERVILEGGYILLFLRFLLFGILAANSTIPKRYSIPIILIFIFYYPIVFNIYNGIYAILGWMVVDRAYFLRPINAK